MIEFNNLTELIQSIPSKNWLHYIINNNPKINFISNKYKKECKKLIIDKICEYASSYRIEKLINYTTLGIHLYSETIMDDLKSKGVLRHISYINKRNPIPILTKYLIENNNQFQLTEDSYTYIKSINNSYNIFFEYKKLHYECHNILKKYTSNKRLSSKYGGSFSIIKSLLAYNDYLFLTDKSENFDILDGVNVEFPINKERISEAISFIVNLFYEHYNVAEQKKGFLINEEFINGGDISHLINYAVLIDDLKEIEIKIEHLGYECELDINKIIIKHKNEILAKSLDLTEIIGSFQSNANSLNIRELNKDFPSVEVFINEAYKIYPNMLEFVPGIYPRLRLILPPQIVKFISEQFDEFTFIENIHIYEDLKRMLFVEHDKLDTYIIRNNLSLYDFFKLYNMIWLIAMIQRKKILDYKDKFDQIIILRSLVPNFTKNQIIELLNYTNIDQSKIEVFLEIVTYFHGNSNFLDLQYQPIIFHCKYYYLSLSVFSLSRFGRNIFPLEAKKGNIIKNNQTRNIDPISAIIKKELENVGFEVNLEVSIKYKSVFQNECDIDVFAIKDNLVLVFECKDIIEYTTAYELRTSFDQVKKASYQLTYINHVLSDKIYLKELINRFCKYNSKINYIFQSAIILSNKSFWGMHYNGFPIRSLHEFTGYLEHGELLIKKSQEEAITFNVWKSDELQNDIIINYFSQDSYHSFFYNSMVENSKRITDSVFSNRYGLDFEKLIESLKNNFPWRTINKI